MTVPLPVDDILAEEWCALLALGEALPTPSRLKIAVIASRALLGASGELVQHLEDALRDSLPRIPALTVIPGSDYSWGAFLESWLSGVDDRRWASEPLRKCRLGEFFNEAPSATDRALVDILLLRHGPDDAEQGTRLTVQDPVAGRVLEALYADRLEGIQDASGLLRYLVWKWVGDIRLLIDREELAHDAYCRALAVLESHCTRVSRDHLLPGALLSVLWLETDPRIWRQWLGGMRVFYAQTRVAGTIESVRWRKEYNHHASRAKWMTVNENPTFPVELSSPVDWEHLSRVSDHASSLMDAAQTERASAATTSALRLALAAGCFSLLPELISYRARLSLADGAYRDAVTAHIRAGREDMEREVSQLAPGALAALTRTIADNVGELRAVAEAEHSQRTFRASTYARLLRDLAQNNRLPTSLRVRLLPELLRLLGEGRNALLVSADVARASAQALVNLVQSAGPSALEPYCEGIANACLDRVERTDDWRLNDLVFQMLFTMVHVDAFQPYLERTIRTVVTYLERLPHPGEPWPAVLPAFGILALDRSLQVASNSDELRDRIVQQTRRHFADNLMISRLHADLPLAILHVLDPTTELRTVLVARAIAETRVQSSESMQVLQKLVRRGRVADEGLLATIANAAADIVSWRGDEGRFAISLPSTPHLIYDLLQTSVPSSALSSLWGAVKSLLDECKVAPNRLAISEIADQNIIVLANWITALLLLGERVGGRDDAEGIAEAFAKQSSWAAGAVLRGRINTRLGRVKVADTLGSADEFYSALPYHLANAEGIAASDIVSLIDATLRFGPRAADVGVFTLAFSRREGFAWDPEPKRSILLDYRWRLEAMELALQDLLRPLLRRLAPPSIE